MDIVRTVNQKGMKTWSKDPSEMASLADVARIYHVMIMSLEEHQLKFLWKQPLGVVKGCDMHG
jgi:hypothetical protein